MSEKKYDVFLSYAHADAQTEEQKTLVAAIKEAIEKVLQSVNGKESFVFLDSEALGWGEEWSAKIRQCIDMAQIFVYLLSPNYLRSSYCQREKLWWARHEIRQGRLNKTIRPIYYVRLPEIGDDDTIEAVKEQMICQTDGQPFLKNPDADGKPFFNSLDEIRMENIKERLNQLNKIKGDIEKIAKQTNGCGKICTIGKFNEYFAGRLRDLAKLNELCQENGTIPVISGYAGIGKSELAITYSHAYAEDFPQGRFLIPMQGVAGWDAALSRLVEQLKVRDIDPVQVGLPEGLDKLEAADKGKTVWKWLRERAKAGQLLLLLDNLEKMELLDSVPDRWSYQDDRELPIRIMVTTRLEKIPASGRSRWELFPVEKLDHKDALELFCLIGGNVFPFANWPFSTDGKLLLDEHLPPGQRPPQEKVEEIEKEFDALNQIIDLLQGHPWSLEIVAGFMAKNTGYSFREKLKDLQKNPAVWGKVTKNGVAELRNPEILLQPTFEQILKFNEISPKLGTNIHWLATAASFFPPEQVPLYALEGIWEQEFGDKRILWSDGERCDHTCHLALTSLREQRILSGDGPILKMHRITQGILRKQSEQKEWTPVIFEAMRKYLDTFLDETPDPTAEQLLPWCDWAKARMSSSSVDESVIDTINKIAWLCTANGLYQSIESLLVISLVHARKIKYLRGVSCCLRVLGNIHEIQKWWNNQAEWEYRHALKLLISTEEKSQNINSDLANIYNSLAILHSNQGRIDEAESEYTQALKYCKMLPDSDKYGSTIATTLNNLAILHSNQGRADEAESEYTQVLKYYKSLSYSDKYRSAIAATLNNLAILYSDQKRFVEAESTLKESLKITEGLIIINFKKYITEFADRCYNLATLYKDQNRMDEAVIEYENALERYHSLEKDTPWKANGIERTLDQLSSVADELNELACKFKCQKQYAKAENILNQVMKIRQRIFNEMPDGGNVFVQSDIAFTLKNLGDLYERKNQIDLAEKYYCNALDEFLELQQSDEKVFMPHAAEILTRLASLFVNQKRLEEAERAYGKALDIFRKLADTDPVGYTVYLEKTLKSLASVREAIRRAAQDGE